MRRTVAAIRCNPDLRAKYTALRDAGKPAKVAITAVMRKLIILANVLVQQDRRRSRRCWISAQPMAPERGSRGGGGTAGARRTTDGSGAGCTWRTGPSGSRKPRLRSPDEGDVSIPAYEALRRPSGLWGRMLELLLLGLSTRSYGKAIGERARLFVLDGSKALRKAVGQVFGSACLVQRAAGTTRCAM